MAKAKGTSRKKTVFMSLFGLPFFAVGCVMGWLGATMCVRHVQARSWPEIPAHVESIELNRGEDTDSVACVYRYTFEGRTYEGNKVGLSGGSDNIGSWQRRTYRRLRSARQQGRTVPCFVDPDHPTTAYLDRDLRWELLLFHSAFVVIFGGAGGFFIAGSFLGARTERKQQQRRLAHPDEPWLVNEQWASGTIRSDLKVAMLGWWALALFWNAISIPTAFPVIFEAVMKDRAYWALLFLVFPLIGLVILIRAFRATIRHLRFGRSYLVLDTVPGVIGGQFRATVVLVSSNPDFEHVETTLACTRTYKSGDTTKTDTAWKHTQTCDDLSMRIGQPETSLPAEFQIPHGLPPIRDNDDDDDDNNSGEIQWKLEVHARRPGVDLAVDWDVPVFVTPESDASVGESAERVEAERTALASDDSPDPARLRQSRDPDGHLRITDACWPGWGTFAVILIVALLFSGATVFLARAMDKLSLFLCILVPLLFTFGLLSLLLWYVVAGFLGSFTITIRGRTLHVRRRIGPFSRSRTVPADQITRLFVKKTTSSGDKKWFSVYAELARPEGKRRLTPKVQIAGMVRGKIAAQWLRRRIAEELDLPTLTTPPDSRIITPPDPPAGRPGKPIGGQDT